VDAKGYLYAAEMTDLLTTAVDKDQWNRVFIPELGSLSRFFAHMIKVRNVYRDGLLTGIMDFTRTIDTKIIDFEAELAKSRYELAEAISHPKYNKIKWEELELSSAEVCSAAIQHEGIHQGQWYVALKQRGFRMPNQWKLDWGLE
jgi:uncharacterized damage-inducible protein DinB